MPPSKDNLVVLEDLELKIKERQSKLFALESRLVDVEEQCHKKVRLTDEAISRKNEEFESNRLTEESKIFRRNRELDDRQREIEKNEGVLKIVAKESESLNKERSAFLEDKKNHEKEKREIYTLKENCEKTIKRYEENINAILNLIQQNRITG